MRLMELIRLFLKICGQIAVGRESVRLWPGFLRASFAWNSSLLLTLGRSNGGTVLSFPCSPSLARTCFPALLRRIPFARLSVISALFLGISYSQSYSQVVFFEPFDEVNFSTSGVDNVGGVTWITTCPGCVDAGDWMDVRSNALEARDAAGDFGPGATWETTAPINISSCGNIIISFDLQDIGDMEGCTAGCGCNCVDWVQLEYNIDGGGWTTPVGATFCGQTCAGSFYIQIDDIPTGSLSYATPCLPGPFSTLLLRITAQNWAASETWIIDNITVSCGASAGLDSTIAFCPTSPAANLFDYLGGTPDGGGAWTGPSVLPGGDLGTFNPAIHTAGLYRYVVGVAPCTDTAEVTVSIIPAPIPGSDYTFAMCSGQNAVNLFDSLGGTPDPGGTWSGPSALSGGALGTFDPAVNVGGVYTYYVGAPPCWDSAQVTVSLNQKPALVITHPSGVCFPGQIDLSSPAIVAGTTPGGLVFTYYLDPGALIPVGPIVSDSSHTYYLVAENPGAPSCYDTAAVNVTINPKPQLLITNPAPVCYPATVNITTAATTTGSTLFGATLSYFKNPPPAAVIPDPTDISDSTWTYYIVATTPGAPACTDTAPVVVTINQLPQLSITDPTAVCLPNTVDLTSAAITAGSSLFGASLSYFKASPPASPLLVPTTVGDSTWTYYILASTPTVPSCTDTAQVNVTVHPKPNLLVNNPAAICPGGIVNLTLPAVTAGSSLLGASLSYFMDVPPAAVLVSPTTVGDSTWTYYIVASTPTAPACSDTSAVVVTVNPKPDLLTTNPSAVCDPGTVDLTSPAITAGSALFGATLSYFENPPPAAIVGSPTTVGDSTWTYYIVASTPTIPSCSDTAPVVVTIHPKPSLLVTDPAAVCQLNTVDLTVPAVTAGSILLGSTLSYFEGIPPATALAAPNTVGDSTWTYYIVATTGSAPACLDTASVNVIIHPRPVVVTNNPAAICGPNCIDLTTAAITAGSTPGLAYSYFTNSAATIPLATPTAVCASGTYYVVGSTGFSCTDTASVIVTIHAKPNLSITPPGPVCSPTCVDITVPAITAGSTLGLTLTYWEDVAATVPLVGPSNLCDSTYIYYIVGTSGSVPACTDTAPLLVRIDDVPVAVNITTVCNPLGTKYTVSFNISSGDTASYAVTGGLGTLNVAHFESDSIISGVPYFFNLDDMFACGPRVISGNKICNCVTYSGTMDLAPITACENASITAIHNADSITDPNDLMSFVLHSNGGNSLGTVIDSSLTPTFSYDSSMTYGTTYYISAVVADGQSNGFADLNDLCLSVAPGTPVIWRKLPIGVPAVDTVCHVSPINLIPVTDVASATYTWTGDNGSSGSGNIIDTVLNPGTVPLDITYTITPTRLPPTMCIGPDFNFVVTVMPEPVGNSVRDTVCSGTMLAIVPTANTAGTTFSWNGSNGSMGNGVINNSPVNSAALRDSVTYTILPVGPAPTLCAGSSFNAIVQVEPIPLGVEVRDTVCSGTLLAINPGANVVGTTFSWNGDNGSMGSGVINDSTSNPLAIQDSVIYSVQPTGPAPELCSGVIFDILVLVDPIPVGIFFKDTVCSGTVLALTPTSTVAGSSFLWLGDNGSMGAGVINDSITNLSGVQDSVIYTISPSGPLSSSCPGNDFSIVVSMPPIPSIALLGDTIICAGGTADLHLQLTGNGPFDVIYTDINSGVNDTLYNISSGYIESRSPADSSVYIPLAVFDDSNPTCSGTVAGSATVDVISAPTVTMSGSSVICSGDSAMLTFTATGIGPFDITYSTGGPPIGINGISASHNLMVSPAATTNYLPLSILDLGSPGCTGSGSGNSLVTVNSLPTGTISGTTTICSGDSADLTFTLTGNGPFSLVFANSSGDTAAVSGVNTGYQHSVGPSSTATYTLVALQDANTPICAATSLLGSATTTVVTLPTAIVTGDTTICPGDSADLTFSLTGIGPFEVVFEDNLANSNTLFNITNGYRHTVFPSNPNTVYTLISVRDASVAGCYGPVSASAIVNMPDFNSSIQVINDSCFASCTGAIVATPLGGTEVAGYTYQWSAGIATPADSIARDLCMGSYSLSVFDDIGCEIIFTNLNVTQPLPLAVDTLSTPSNCNQPNGSATVNVSGGTPPFGPYTYQWDAAAANQNTATAIGLVSGNYQVYVVDNQGCDTTITAVVRDRAGVSAILAIAPTTQCFDTCQGTAQIAATGGSPLYNFQWYYTNFTPIVGAINSNILGLCGGAYWCIVQDADNCKDTVSVPVPEYPELVLTTSPDLTKCALDSTELIASGAGGNGGPYSFNWSHTPNNGFSQWVSPTTTTIYLVQATDGNCVSAFGQITIDLFPALNVLATVDGNDTICFGETVQLRATGGGGNNPTNFDYSWDNGIGPIQNPMVSPPTAPISYFVTLSDQGCSTPVTDFVTIYNYPTPISSFVAKQEGNCEPVTLALSRVNDPTVSTCIWDFGDGNFISECELNTYTYTNAGSYHLRLITENFYGCADTSIVDTIDVDRSPIADFNYLPQNTTILRPEIEFLDKSIGNGEITGWYWDFAKLGYSGEQDPTFQFPDDIERKYPVYLTVINEFNCIDTVLHYVKIGAEFFLYVPNAFSPNMDGINETFYPRMSGYADQFYRLFVFSRWGDIVYETRDTFGQWDGTYQNGGKECAEGVYLWKIEINSDATQVLDIESFMGHVTLLR